MKEQWFRAKFGQYITQRRREKGWTMHELSRRSGIKLATLHALEHGNSGAKIMHAYMLAQAFKERPFSEFMQEPESWQK